MPDAAWAAFVRSPHPHARIVGLDIAAVASVSGTLSVVTAADLADDPRSLRCYCPVTGRDKRPNRDADWTILAAGRVRHVGEAVACVLTPTQAAAVAAAWAIWPEAPDNLCFDCETGDAGETDRLIRGTTHESQCRNH
ncbi:hypothetical protein MKK75_03915 [Methylobacterium sp. J-030]|nr:hypothetical protein [Methylobacterium sp. J-030]